MGINISGLLQGALNKASTLVNPAALSRIGSKLPGKAKGLSGLATAGLTAAGILRPEGNAQGAGMRSNIMNLLSMIPLAGDLFAGDVPTLATAEPTAAEREMEKSWESPKIGQVQNVQQNQPSISTPSSVRTPSGPVPVPGKSTSSFSQTPQSSAPAVSPVALARVASNTSPGAPGGSPTPFSAPAPATPSLSMAYGGGSQSSPITGIQAAVLRRLAERGNKQAPAGYVGTPEGMPIGAAPRRRLRNDDNY